MGPTLRPWLSGGGWEWGRGRKVTGCTSTLETEAAVLCVLLAAGDQAAQEEEAAARCTEF